VLEIAYGNIVQEEADRLEAAAGPAPDGVPHEPGGAEPWISRLVHSFILASGAKTVLETGCFKGATSSWMYDALAKLGGGHLHLCEIEEERLVATTHRIYNARVASSNVEVTVHAGDVLQYLATTEDRFDLAWVDDDHEKPHVLQELLLLHPKMNPGGIILGHDVWGTCDLQEVFRKFGGLSLDLPRLGSAGGIGIIQCR
jgi:predicted O-methyltransferase YrrM